MAKLRQLFNIDGSYTEDQARTIAGVRYELSIKSLTDAQYVFADDVSVELISQTADGQYRGVSTGISSARVYNTEYAAHVLGRLSPIYYEDWVGDPENGITGYRDMEGYSMNSLVGREGAERPLNPISTAPRAPASSPPIRRARSPASSIPRNLSPAVPWP